MLAEKMLVPYYEIMYMEEQCGEKNGPTALLLKKWENQERSLEEFRTIMVDMERLDVVEDVDQLIGIH